MTAIILTARIVAALIIALVCTIGCAFLGTVLGDTSVIPMMGGVMGAFAGVAFMVVTVRRY